MPRKRIQITPKSIPKWFAELVIGLARVFAGILNQNPNSRNLSRENRTRISPQENVWINTKKVCLSIANDVLQQKTVLIKELF